MARTSRRARRNSPFHLPIAFELFTPSKEIVLNNIWIFGPLYAVPLIFYIHSWIWSPLPHQSVHWWQHSDNLSPGWTGSTLPTYLTFLVVGFSLLWFIIIFAIGTIVQIMSQAAQLDAVEKKPLDFQDLWKIVKELGWRMFGLYITLAVIVVVGLLLLVIPGLIMIRRYIFAPFIMLEKKTGIRESLDRSADLSRLNTGSVWGLLGVMFLISLVNIVPIIGGLASFALGALYSVAPALRYQQLKQLAAQ
ncbi:MAG TPA: hypothetical protein VFH37_03210 [Candidatus Saccharimonadales bacterium]|nr:hypothetical protein [Candidatus Saccharimonadales bacterium]